MRIYNSVLAVIAAALLFAHCAKTGRENYSEREQEVFDLWMEAHHDRPGVERLDNGMYIERLREGSGRVLEEDSWMYVDYRGYDLNGNMFSNRDSTIARREGTYTPYTHYADHYAIFNKGAYYFTAGEYEALAGMREGDSVRLYMPSMLAYGSTNSTYFSLGYEGWYNSAKNPANVTGGSSSVPPMTGRPVIIDLALNRVVADAQGQELIDAEQEAARLGYIVPDSVRQGLFFRYVEEDESEVSGMDQDAPAIKEDSTFYFVYALRLLDDFLVATNDAATASLDWGVHFGGDEYAPTYFSKSSNVLANGTSGRYISALNELIKSERVDLRYNSRMQLLFTSEWAYGYYGDPATSTKPVVYPYTPLKMDVIILEYGYDPDGEDEEEEEEPAEEE